MLVAAAPFIYRKYRPVPAFTGSGVVTVVSVVGGYQGKRWGNFDHRVRLESGVEGTMAFRDITRRQVGSWSRLTYVPVPHSNRGRWLARKVFRGLERSRSVHSALNPRR